MSSSLITVAIPAYNRPDFLEESLKSVLKQTHGDIQIMVIDNASEMDLKLVVERCGDSRVLYFRNNCNLGIIGNWNKAVELCKTRYLSIFHDDDVMLPEFIKKTVTVLEENSEVDMVYTQANKVDPDLRYISLWSELYPNEGIIKGFDYLWYTVDKGCCITIAPTVVFRRSVFDKVGLFNDCLCFNSFDFNMWVRIADQSNLFFIKEVLVNYRLHEKQMSKEYWFTKGKPIGRLATMIELNRVVYLLSKKDGVWNDAEKARWLWQKMDEQNQLIADYARQLVVGL